MYVTKGVYKHVGYPNYSDKSVTIPGQTIDLEQVAQDMQRGKPVRMYAASFDKDASHETMIVNKHDFRNLTEAQLDAKYGTDTTVSNNVVQSAKHEDSQAASPDVNSE